MKNEKLKIWGLALRSIATKGFTLIELLVVISIIGILASLTLVSFSGAQKQTRDTQRRSDLAQYRNALESYAASNVGMYPSSGPAVYINAAELCNAVAFQPFISSCPRDPLETASRWYLYRTNNSSPIGEPRATKYLLFVVGGLETGGTWVICYDGKSGKTDNTWTAILSYCPL